MSDASRKTGLAKAAHKICHFRSGKLYRASRRGLMRLRGRPIAHFLHVRKAGGSAIKAGLRPHATTGPFFLEFHPHRITIEHIPKGEKVFFFVRDPASRFVSGFYSRKRQGAPAHYVPWSDAERQVFEQFDTANAIALALGSDHEPTRQGAHHAMKALGHVNSSYWDWFVDEATFEQRIGDVLFVGRQEHLNDDFNAMLQKLQLPADIRLPQDLKSSNRNPGTNGGELTDQALDALKRYYAADYRFLAYCQEKLGLCGYSTDRPTP